ncbi:MAG: endonuclease NucS domain-containing protein [Candidatus Odinarchaeota archaeon]
MDAPDQREEPLPWLTAIEKMGKQKSYKPILLLSVIAEIETGSISENQIPLTDSLVQRFNTFYGDAGNDQALDKSFLPYYYLQSDVWDIHWEASGPEKCPSSNSGTRKRIKHVTFKPGLFELLKERSTREAIKERLFLKAEEDIKVLDTRGNEAFRPPGNIVELLEKNFGKVTLEVEMEPTVATKDTVSLEFAQEKLLKEFLVNRWNEIPEFRAKKLQIYGGVDLGVEYDTGTAGKIDILAENSKNRNLTVIELKRGKSGERHLGQLLRYMGWVRGKLAGEKDVYGMLIASGFQESIRYAIGELKAVSLMEYELLFRLHPVSFG